MSKELSNREQKFRDEYMDILYQAIRKEHPPGKYLLLDKDDLRIDGTVQKSLSRRRIYWYEWY